MPSQLDMFSDPARPGLPKAKGRARPSTPVGLAPALSHDAMAATLEATGAYRILRKLRRPEIAADPRPGFPRLAVIVDTETTGLNKAQDEVIEVGAVAFRYSEAGDIGDIVGLFGALQQPSSPIPPEITKLTSITDDMVAGQTISIPELDAFMAGADLVIAHNAAFDRPFCERLSSVFADKAWACSNNEIDWRARSFEGTKLGYLLSQSGLFHDGHRAVDDCLALLEILGSNAAGMTPFSELLASSRKARVRLWAEHSPFDKKDTLKARGYRWSSGEDQQPKAWWTEVDADDLGAEISYLQAEIYGRTDVEPTRKTLTAMERFKG